MKFFVVTILTALHFSRVESVCYCPYQGTGIYYPCGDSTCQYYRRKTCDDLESQNECEQANWELLNKRDTTVSLVERLMKNSLKNGNLTNFEVGYIRSILARAVENGRPEGDCSNGLSTTHRIGGTLTHCFSWELLRQCNKVAAGVDIYLDGIAPRLEKYARETGLLHGGNDRLHKSMAEIVEVVRIYTSAKTARVRCASFNATRLEISGAPTTWMATASIIASILLALVM